MTYRHQIGPWTLSSAFALPGLDVWDQPCSAPDIVIEAAPIPPRFSEAPVFDHPVYRVWADGAVLLTIPGLLQIAVTGGSRVIVQALAAPDSQSLGMILRGPVLAILARQRQILPFWGAAVRYDEKALVLLGRPGVGKSVLAALLAQRGFDLLADGLCLLAPALHSMPSFLRLWQPARNQLGLGDGVEDGAAFIPMPRSSDQTVGPVPLRQIFVLSDLRPPQGDRLPYALPLPQMIGYLSGLLAAAPAVTASPFAPRLGSELAAVVMAGKPLWLPAATEWDQAEPLVSTLLDALEKQP